MLVSPLLIIAISMINKDFMLAASNVKIALLVHVDHKSYNKILYVNSILINKNLRCGN